MQEKLVFKCHFCPLKVYGEKGKHHLECHLEFNHNGQLNQSISEDYGDLELNENLVKPIVPVPCLEFDGVLQPILNSDGKLLPPSEFAESEFSQITTSICEEERKYNKNINLNTSSGIELEADANTNVMSIQDHELSKIRDSKLIVQEDHSGKFVKNELETSTLSIEENLLSLRSSGHENEVPAQLLNTNTFGCNLFSYKQYTEKNYFNKKYPDTCKLVKSKVSNDFGNSNEIATETVPNRESSDFQEYMLPYGWKKVGYRRTSNRWDFYIITPDGKKLRSSVKVKEYLEKNPNVLCDIKVTNTNRPKNLPAYNLQGYKHRTTEIDVQEENRFVESSLLERRPKCAHICDKCSISFKSKQTLINHNKKFHTSTQLQKIPAVSQSHNRISSAMNVTSNINSALYQEYAIENQGLHSQIILPKIPISLETFQSAQAQKELYKCPKCSSIFSSQELANDHYRMAHAVKYIFKCLICNAVFSCEKNLRIHSQFSHNLDTFELSSRSVVKITSQELLEQSTSKVSQEKSKSLINKRESDSYLPASKSMKLESKHDESDEINLNEHTESIACTQNIKKEKVSEEESKIDIKEEWKQSEEFENIFGY